MLERPNKAEVIAVRGSPGELDLIRMDLIINYVTGAVTYPNVRPLNYRRKPYTCVGPRPGDMVDVAWRGDQPVFIADFEVEWEDCTGSSMAAPTGESEPDPTDLGSSGRSIGPAVGSPGEASV